MKMKKTVVLLAVVFAVFALTSTAMAQNRVEVKVTSEPIAYQAECDKAGGFSLEFDQNTRIQEGDQITIDLSWLSPSDFAQICKEIDLEISRGSGIGWSFADIPNGAPSTTYAFYWAGAVAPTNGVGEIYFRIHGAVDTQRVTVDVLGAADGDYVEVGDAPDSKIILTFLDQKENPRIDEDAIWIDPDAVTGLEDGVYSTAATFSDNTLCIDVTQYSLSTVKANLDSRLDKYTFIPSDPQIAHVASQAGISIVECGGKATNNPGRTNCGVIIPAETNGVETHTCTAFDFDDDDGGANAFGYISTTRTGNNRLIIQSVEPFEDAGYEIRLEILVDGEGGDNGVYFSNQDVEYAGFNSVANACLAPVNISDDAGLVNVDVATYRNAAGSSVGIVPTAPAGYTRAADCTVATTERAVYLQTEVFDPADDATVMLVDVPAFNYDWTVIESGGVVAVKVTLIRTPCGEIEIGTKTVATLCPAAPPVVPTYASTIVYPYLTAANNDNWWDGIVITNLSSTDGSFTAIVYEQDGDVGAFTGTVLANSLYQNTLQSAMEGATQVSGDGTLGDSMCYMIVCHDFIADGFAFMGSLSTNSLMANESMGYVPRVTYDDGSINFCQTLQIIAGTLP